jgi:ATP-dependent DNA helicase RecQ
MVSFVETGQCRRRPLLSYFGETYEAESCDFCDNCLAEEQEQADLTIPAQKFLSCVKRTGEIFGMTHIIDVLRGSRAKRCCKRGMIASLLTILAASFPKRSGNIWPANLSSRA